MSEDTQFNKKRGYRLVGEKEKAINNGLFLLGIIIIFIATFQELILLRKISYFPKLNSETE